MTSETADPSYTGPLEFDGAVPFDGDDSAGNGVVDGRAVTEPLGDPGHRGARRTVGRIEIERLRLAHGVRSR
jgi:hypothetical protein